MFCHDRPTLPPLMESSPQVFGSFLLGSFEMPQGPSHPHLTLQYPQTLPYAVGPSISFFYTGADSASLPNL